jgi:integrase
MAITPAHRNAVLRVLGILFEHGVRLGWLHRNPAAKPGIEKLEPSGLVWPSEAIDAFVAAADARGRHSIGTAVLLNEWLGQRQGDILRLKRSAIVDGTIHIKQGKTGSRVALEIDAVARLWQRFQAEVARVEARDYGHRALPEELIVDEKAGRRYAGDHFRHLFAEIRADVARVQPKFHVDCLLPGRDANDPEAFLVQVTDLTYRHLRHTAVTRLAEAGCDVTSIAAVTGHSPRSINVIMEHYLVKTRKLARLAFEQRLSAEAPVVTPRRGLARIIPLSPPATN